MLIIHKITYHFSDNVLKTLLFLFYRLMLPQSLQWMEWYWFWKDMKIAIYCIMIVNIFQHFMMRQNQKYGNIQNTLSGYTHLPTFCGFEIPYNRKKETRLLLCGSEESGKTTIFKQMKMIYKSGYSNKDRLKWRIIIHNQVIQDMKWCLQCIKQVKEKQDELTDDGWKGA